MSRHFEPITVDELKKKIEGRRVDNEWVEYRRLTPTVEKDLDKVSFDCENITDEDTQFGSKAILGYHTLPNGMPFFGVCAGGDWESAVFFCIYWDGKKLRGYIPEKGNLWNTDTNQAYGNDDDYDLKNARKRWPDNEDLKNDDIDLAGWFNDYDIEAMKEDIMTRIVLTKPQKSSKVREGGALLTYTDDELLAELKRRLEDKNGK
jgi:hypothetical protein